MPSKVRTHLALDSLSDRRLAPKHLTRQEFGKRLYNLMLSKGWHQSELARQSGLPRDSISTYIRGKSLPTPGSVKALAEVFGIKEEELLPNHAESAIDEDIPSIEMKVSPSAPAVAWLRINRMVTTKTAMKIVSILEDDGVSDGKGSR